MLTLDGWQHIGSTITGIVVTLIAFGAAMGIEHIQPSFDAVYVLRVGYHALLFALVLNLLVFGFTLPIQEFLDRLPAFHWQLFGGVLVFALALIIIFFNMCQVLFYCWFGPPIEHLSTLGRLHR